MVLKLYHFPLSSPSRAAYMSVKAVGIPADIIIVDLLKKEQLSESFVKINPQHCIPTIDDDGFVLWESKAIACYLAEKHGRDDLYPKDLKRRAVVNQRLYYDSSMLYPRIRAINYPILFQGVKEIKKELADDLNVQLGFLNHYLGESKWVAGDEMTVADIAIAASISTVMAVGWDFSAFPNIQKWFSNCETIPGFQDNMEGAKKFGDAVRKNLE
ncbi:unnamed protein product [Leptosia nina]|uniref:Glutathione S-transferase n=1 Tax=Leptosia nina TaxID=320188 RepID=A0AAV1JMR2_9NEOP